MARLRSVIVHDDVSFIEIRRGEGIDGGDTIVVGVEHPGSEEPSEGYYFLPSSALRLNRYRLRLSVADIEVRVDPEIAKMLGMIHPAKGKTTVRSVFIIDPQGVLRLILEYPPEVGRNMDELLRIIKAFQVADKYKVAIPANWPNNELIGDQVIIPPASDVKTARERLSKYQCYDWWFCYQKL